MNARTKRWAAGLLALLTLCIGIYLGYAQICAPKMPAEFEEKTVTLEEVQGEGPSLNMMLSHLKILSQRMHVAGSAAQGEVHQYLVSQIQEMGYQPIVESYSLTPYQIYEIEKTHRNHQDDVYDEAEIRDYADMPEGKETLDLKNVLVRLDAPGTDRGVLIMAHYDSVKFGPGASDDLISVTALMESLRNLSGKELKNDLYFLFTDGEEQGLLGAACFVDAHPELKDRLAFVVNIESRGQRGALLMFETTQNNLGLMDVYNQGVPQKVSFSIATAVYQMMSNDTDLSEFMLAGYPGLNFACIEGAEVYHTENDTFEGIDRNTAYHYLNTATQFTEYLATAELPDVTSTQDAVFFPLTSGNLVIMSATTAQILGFVTAALGILTIALLCVKRRIRLRALLQAALLQIGLIGGFFLICWGIVRIAISSAGLTTMREYLTWAGSTPLFLILMAAGILILGALMIFLCRKSLSPAEKMAGMLPLLILGSIGLAIGFNAASYLFSIPLALLSIGLMLYTLLPKGNAIIAGIGAVLFTLIVLLLYVPIAYLFYIAMALPMAPVAIAFGMIPITISACCFSTLFRWEPKPTHAEA